MQSGDEELHHRMRVMMEAAYAERWIIVFGGSTLEISQFVALVDDDDEVAAQEDLLAALALGD